jgi:predicted phosphodiesterase
MLRYFSKLRRAYRCITKVVSQELSKAGVKKNAHRFAVFRDPSRRDRYLKVLQKKGWSWGKFSFRLTEAYMSRVLSDKRNIKEVVVGLHTRAVLLSDVHLGYHRFDPNRELFERKLDDFANQKFDYLIIQGDFIDLWRAEFEEVVLKYQSIFEKLRIMGANGTRIIYILGNHDYEVSKHKKYFDHFPNFEIIGSGVMYTVLEDTGKIKGIITMVHGHQYDIRLRYFTRLYPFIGWCYRRIYKITRRLRFSG